MRRLLTSFAVSVSLVAALTACGKTKSTTTDTTGGYGSPGSTTTAGPSTTAPTTTGVASGSVPKQGDANVKVTGDLGKKPVVKLPGGEPPKELLFKDLTVGTGAVVKADTSATFQYVGISWSTGKQFDASWDRGQPFTSRLSKGSLINGWVNAIPGMKVGGRRLLIIPPDQGYGASGQGADIGPNETLVFVIDAL